MQQTYNAFPTQVGVNQAAVADAADLQRFPHAGGGEPGPAMIPTILMPPSPRGWGQTVV